MQSEFKSSITFFSFPELVRQAQSAKLLEDKVRRAESEYHEMEQEKQRLESERAMLAEQAKKEKKESESSRKKAREMEEKAQRMAAEAKAKSEEISAIKAEVRYINVTLYDLRTYAHTKPYITITSLVQYIVYGQMLWVRLLCRNGMP